MLEVKNLEVPYGQVQVVWGVSLEVPEHSIVALIGPNGAGKTTTLKSILGLLAAQEGDITFRGEAITNMATHEIVNRGLVLVPEWRGTFSTLTVPENLELGAYPPRARPYKDETLQVFMPGSVSAEMGRAAAANLAADLGFGHHQEKRSADLKSLYVLDSGGHGLFMSLGAQPWLNVQLNLPGPWGHWAKLIAEKYQMWQIKSGNY
jgi:ABC-type branched-subunit amino acid transport system ATPase component